MFRIDAWLILAILLLQYGLELRYNLKFVSLGTYEYWIGSAMMFLALMILVRAGKSK